MLRAVADLGLRRVITFHSRIGSARAFATDPLEAAELLKDEDRPERLWARAVAGTDRLEDRRAAFKDFAAGPAGDVEQGAAPGLRHVTYGPFSLPLDLLNIPRRLVYKITEALKRPRHQSGEVNLRANAGGGQITRWTDALRPRRVTPFRAWTPRRSQAEMH
ncbi:hypothetical protein GCM10010430_75560 [Kitasatospora cystarginea]|uniref:Uncharacterized protein n=1 Tax=Kitasatospora cystarginea TaxID=58350 RepID=A0ABP5RW65_9ACTN